VVIHRTDLFIRPLLEALCGRQLWRDLMIGDSGLAHYHAMLADRQNLSNGHIVKAILPGMSRALTPVHRS